MPLFRCESCGCVENTALSNYWTRDRDDAFNKITPTPPALCSGCDPQTGVWHGQFEQRSADGMLIGEDGFLYADSHEATQLNARIRGVIADGQEQPITQRQTGSGFASAKEGRK